MPSKLTIKESSDEPMPTEYGGKIEKLDSGKATAKASRLAVEEANAQKKVPVVQGGSIKRIKRSSLKEKRWFYDDRNNPLRVRQWVYEVILGVAVLVVLISFLVTVVGSARQGKLDLQSFLGGIGTFLGGLGCGYGYRAKREGKRHKSHSDDDEEQENDAGDDTS